jgi:predicted transcriptional regulator
LLEKLGPATGEARFRLTPAGAVHWQRSASARRAELPVPAQPFRSDRVRDVLAHLASQGPTRTRDIGVKLDVSPTSINALMQYLKRKKAVRNRTDMRFAPYELTPEGRDMLAVMQRRAGTAAAA